MPEDLLSILQRTTSIDRTGLDADGCKFCQSVNFKPSRLSEDGRFIYAHCNNCNGLNISEAPSVLLG